MVIVSCAASAVRGAQIYITMPPCRNCYGSCVAAGIRRIVSRKKQLVERITKSTEAMQIEFVCISDTVARLERIDALFRKAKTRE